MNKEIIVFQLSPNQDCWSTWREDKKGLAVTPLSQVTIFFTKLLKIQPIVGGPWVIICLSFSIWRAELCLQEPVVFFWHQNTLIWEELWQTVWCLSFAAAQFRYWVKSWKSGVCDSEWECQCKQSAEGCHCWQLGWKTPSNELVPVYTEHYLGRGDRWKRF